MRKNTRAGVAGRQAVVAIMAGLLGAAGFAVPAMPVTALAETHEPSVGTENLDDVTYEALTPEEVAALYADTDTPDLSSYYWRYAGRDDRYVPYGSEAPLGYPILAHFNDDAYGDHAEDPVLFRRIVPHVTQTGSGTTDLTMILENSGEFGGTDEPETNPDDGAPNPYYNPDTDGDGLGDNLAFTVPASINYVVKANGDLIGPNAGAAYIENRSAFATHVSSLDVDEENPFNIVADAAAASEANAVDLEIGPVSDMLNAHDYLAKAPTNDASCWNMGTTDNTAEAVLVGTEYETAGPGSGSAYNWTNPIAARMNDMIMSSYYNNDNSNCVYVRRSDGEYAECALLPNAENEARIVDQSTTIALIRVETDAETGDSLMVLCDTVPGYDYDNGIYLDDPRGPFSKLPLTTSGHVANISTDISSTTKFGEIHWYVSTGQATVAGGDTIVTDGNGDQYLLIPNDTCFATTLGDFSQIDALLARHGLEMSAIGDTFVHCADGTFMSTTSMLNEHTSSSIPIENLPFDVPTDICTGAAELKVDSLLAAYSVMIRPNGGEPMDIVISADGLGLYVQL